MESSVKIKSSILLKKEKFKKENNMKEYIKQIYELLNIEYKDLDNYLIDCNYLINHNELEEAKELLKIIINLNNGNSNKIENQINYLINKIKEIEYHKNMTSEEKKTYILYKVIIEECMKRKKHMATILYCISAFQLTKQNEFIYYIGEELYKSKKYTDARKYFNEYIKNGTDKTPECVSYLSKINEAKEGYQKNINDQLNYYKDVSELGDFKYTLGNFYKKEKKHKKPNTMKQNRKIIRKKFYNY